MTSFQRQELFDRMMLGIPREGEHDIAYDVLAQACTEDLDIIEPLIDKWIRESFQAGKRVGMLHKSEAEIRRSETVY